jgi:nitrate/nitrite-specific signal transduction histidine kinase
MWFFSIFSFFAFAALTAYFSDELHSRQVNLEKSNKSLLEKNRSLLFLYHTFGTIASFNDIDPMSEYILAALLEHLNLHRALLYLRTDTKNLSLFKLKERERTGAGNDASDDETAGLSVHIPFDKNAGLTARAAVFQESYNVTKPEDSPYINKELAKKIGLNPFALAPLVFHGETIGVLGIDRSETNGAITADEFRILKLFAGQAAVMISMIRKSS